MKKKTNKRYRKKKNYTRKRKGGKIELAKTNFVGTPWGPTPNQWPSGINANHYTLNTYDKTLPNYNTLQSGGKRRRKKIKKGGNMAWDALGYNFKSMWSTFTTNAQPTSPAPFVQPQLEKIAIN